MPRSIFIDVSLLASECSDFRSDSLSAICWFVIPFNFASVVSSSNVKNVDRRPGLKMISFLDRIPLHCPQTNSRTITVSVCPLPEVFQEADLNMPCPALVYMMGSLHSCSALPVRALVSAVVEIFFSEKLALCAMNLILLRSLRCMGWLGEFCLVLLPPTS